MKKRKDVKSEVSAYELEDENKKVLLQAIGAVRHLIKTYCHLHTYEEKKSLSKKDFERVIIDKAFLPIIQKVNLEIDMVTKQLMTDHGITEEQVKEETKNEGRE